MGFKDEKMEIWDKLDLRRVPRDVLITRIREEIFYDYQCGSLTPEEFEESIQPLLDAMGPVRLKDTPAGEDE